MAYGGAAASLLVRRPACSRHAALRAHRFALLHTTRLPLQMPMNVADLI